jgi:putative glutamine amidotransferase
MSEPKTYDHPRILVLGGGMDEQLRRAGAESVYVSYTSQQAAVEAAEHGNIHGLILTGGVDVNPKVYGASRHPRTQTPNDARDLTELMALRAAYKRRIPILGVCRGSQIINAGFGGTLHQHIADLKHAHNYHLGHDHRVDVTRGTRLYKAVKVKETWVVSIHHQAVDRVAPGFRVNARGRDGIIEGIETSNITEHGWIMGVQFHPEISTNKVTQRIFNAFVRASATKFNMPEPKALASVPRTPLYTASSSAPLNLTTRAITPPKGVRPTVVDRQCFPCGITFDEQVDHVDHMFFFHGIDLLDTMPTADVLAMLADDDEE